MHVFLTGASGQIGTAITQQLLATGHTVTGLARSDASADAIQATGAKVLRGDLDDLEALKAGAAASDGVIHCAFVHNFTQYADACAKDEKAIAAMGSVLAGTNKPLVVSSGTLLIADGTGRPATETDERIDLPGFPRKSEAAAFALVDSGVRATVVRLPPHVHSARTGFVQQLIAIAREKKVSAYVGDGAKRWPFIHVKDSASVFVAALEKGKAGSAYHAIGDEGIPLIKISDIIAKHLEIPLASVAPGPDAIAHFGFLAHVLSIDNPVSGKKTQEELGVVPKEIGILEALETGDYFKA
ncbi:hypothetical protein RQP46_009832 [Phenoliferia psychrophenolica]